MTAGATVGMFVGMISEITVETLVGMSVVVMTDGMSVVVMTDGMTAGMIVVVMAVGMTAGMIVVVMAAGMIVVVTLAGMTAGMTVVTIVEKNAGVIGGMIGRITLKTALSLTNRIALRIPNRKSKDNRILFGGALWPLTMRSGL
jgi:hypothetical protein